MFLIRAIRVSFSPTVAAFGILFASTFIGSIESRGQICNIDPTGTRCTGQCGAPDGICAPKEILTDAAGNFLQITCCDCDTNGCFLNIDPLTLDYSCAGMCPIPGTDCRLVGSGNANGTISYSCECLPPGFEEPCEFVAECNVNCPGTCVQQCQGICPNPDDACVPATITESSPNSGEFTVTECDCGTVGVDECRPVISLNSVHCEGQCPNMGETCKLVTSMAPDGVGLEYRCDPCAPDVGTSGACCLQGPAGGLICIETDEPDCIMQGGFYLGDGTNCVDHGHLCDEIGNPYGACCYEDPFTGQSICTITSMLDCTNQYSGIYQGNATTCYPIDPCEPDDEGACCYQTASGNLACTITTQPECEKVLLGTYFGDGTDCEPNPCGSNGCECVGTCDDQTPAYTDPLYSGFTDEVAVATVSGFDPADLVLINVNFKDRNLAPLNSNWNTATLYSDPSWNIANLGSIFGVALDRFGNTYVTATTSYYFDITGTSGSFGTIYKVAAGTGVISVLATLPNTGPGLGNIAYDGDRDQLFVTNFEDGRIYRLDLAGTCLSTFDHATGTIGTCAPEGGDLAGFADLGERPWGVQVRNNRLYYGLWTEDQGRASNAVTNTIWSIALVAGNFSGVPQLEIVLPPQGGSPTTGVYSNPPSDIAFSETDCMLVAERSMWSDTNPSAHDSRVLEYRLSTSGTWVPSGYNFYIGQSFGSSPASNAAGGVDYDRAGNVVATGDYLLTGPAIYGLQCTPCTGGDPSNSVLRDLNDVFTYGDKMQIGDVEIACAEEPLRGACCIQDPAGGSMCIDTTQVDCEHNLGGLYLGDGTNCADHGQLCDKGGGQYGACCYDDPATGAPLCAMTTSVDCTNVYNGVFQGVATSCTPVPPCPQEVVGSCCYEDVNMNILCTETTQVDCEENLMGIYNGDGTDCTTNGCMQEEGCNCPGNCEDRTPDYEDPLYAGFTDEVAVATISGFAPTDFVLVNVNFKDRNLAPLNTNWNSATLYNHPAWTLSNLGSIFGVAVDQLGHTYVTASTSYNNDVTGTSGSFGTIYRVHATTGAVSVFATLPNTGPGLGNIAYDGTRDQFFVTNFEDGRIYRLSAAGACLSTFDFATGTIGTCAPEAGDAAGFVPLGDRPWGVQVYDDRVYFGVWTEDQGRPNLAVANTVHSIALSGGNFTGTAQLEITLPPLTTGSGPAYSNPPSDISFSETGCMLVAERSMYSDSGPSAHDSRVLEYRQLPSGAWVPSPYTFGIGQSFGSNPPHNAAGGVDYDRAGNVVATGDYILTGPVIYGLQCTPCTGGNPTNSVLRDLNDNFTYSDKTQIGDVEIPCAEKCVPPPKRMVAWWPLDETSGTVANDIVRDNDGTYQGPTPIVGKVSGARNFDGVNDLIRVPHHAVIDFSLNSFSIDAWVRTTAGASLEVILDKRVVPTRGYSLFLFNGQLGLQLADGSTFLNYVRPGSIADGQWHHVAVTVRRASATGLTLYVDGVGVVMNPTGVSGSLSNNAPLWIGARDPAFGQTFFDGDLDEIEIFRRELSAAEVLKLYQAGSAGKCKDRCHVPWDVPICINKNSVIVNLQICNDSPVAHNYSWNVTGATGPGCSGPPPSAFSPSSGTVNIPGGGCVLIPITVTRPAGLTPPLVSCFTTNIVNLDNGFRFSCNGSIQALNKWCFIVIEADPVGVPIGLDRAIVFPVTNDTATSQSLDYELVANPSGMGGGSPLISLDGLPPGDPVTGQVNVPAGGTALVNVSVQYAVFEPFCYFDVVLSADDNGDGIKEAIGSQAIRNVLPCGDFDRDGEVSLTDMEVLAQCLAGPDGGIDPACPPDFDTDCDGDGDSDLRDFSEYQLGFGAVTVSP